MDGETMMVADMITAGGRRVGLWDGERGITREDVNVHDIAQSLALQCRFNGHTRTFYSVAQHSVLAARLVERDGGGPRMRMLALLHDAAEAYIGDIVQPMKRVLDAMGHGLRAMEDDIQRTIEAALLGHDATIEERKLIKSVDDDLVWTEMAFLMRGMDRTWSMQRAAVANVLTEAWPWEIARRRFLGTYYHLAGALGLEA